MSETIQQLLGARMPDVRAPFCAGEAIEPLGQPLHFEARVRGEKRSSTGEVETRERRPGGKAIARPCAQRVGKEREREREDDEGG